MHEQSASLDESFYRENPQNTNDKSSRGNDDFHYNDGNSFGLKLNLSGHVDQRREMHRLNALQQAQSTPFKPASSDSVRKMQTSDIAVGGVPGSALSSSAARRRREAFDAPPRSGNRGFNPSAPSSVRRCLVDWFVTVR